MLLQHCDCWINTTLVENVNKVTVRQLTFKKFKWNFLASVYFQRRYMLKTRNLLAEVSTYGVLTLCHKIRGSDFNLAHPFRRLTSAMASLCFRSWIRVFKDRIMARCITFNTISVISRRLEGVNVRLCAMEPRLRLKRVLPPVGIEPRTARWRKQNMCR